jgi:phosphohistidine phosphatase
MRIVLLRHGIAEDAAAGGDAERALTGEGRKKAREVCKALAGLDLGVERVLSSPLKRALETAHILRDELGLTGEVEVCPALVPEANPSAASPIITGQRAECVALVGHEPHISTYAAWSTGGGTYDVRKCGVIVLEGSGLPGKGGGALVAMFAPRHVRTHK